MHYLPRLPHRYISTMSQGFVQNVVDPKLARYIRIQGDLENFLRREYGDYDFGIAVSTWLLLQKGPCIRELMTEPQAPKRPLALLCAGTSSKGRPPVLEAGAR